MGNLFNRFKKDPSKADQKKAAKGRPLKKAATLALLLGLSVSLSSINASAFEIDSSGFSNPETETSASTMYFWHKGLPPMDTDGYGYPILLTWGYGNGRNNQSPQDFFLLTRPYSFFKLVRYRSVVLGGYKTEEIRKDAYDHGVHRDFWGDFDDAKNIDYKTGYYDHVFYHSVIFGDDYYTYKGDYPSGYYMYKNKFSLVGGNSETYYNKYNWDVNPADMWPLTDYLNDYYLDFDTLQRKGTTFSTMIPYIPCAYATSIPGWYALEYPNYYHFYEDYPGQEPHAATQESRYRSFLIGESYFESYVNTSLKIDAEQVNTMNWSLSDLNVTAEPTFGFPDFSKDTRSKTWGFSKINPGSDDNAYALYTEGKIINRITRISHRWGDWRRVEKFRDRTSADIWMIHDGSSLGAFGGQTSIPEYRLSGDESCIFYVYYAEPFIVSILKGDHEVANGQVTNLDGPIVLPRNSCITIKDGGVLSVNGWVINNGTIKVEPGGTLIVQQNSALTTWETESGLHAGRVLCDGTMIISSNGKLQAGGVEGLKFGEGSHCVNYGALMAENLSVYGSRVIENRGSMAVVYAGYGTGESGYSLVAASASDLANGTTAKNNGLLDTVEQCRIITMASDAVYGEGSVYVNGDSLTTFRQESAGERSMTTAFSGGTDPQTKTIASGKIRPMSQWWTLRMGKQS